MLLPAARFDLRKCNVLPSSGDKLCIDRYRGSLFKAPHFQKSTDQYDLRNIAFTFNLAQSYFLILNQSIDTLI